MSIESQLKKRLSKVQANLQKANSKNNLKKLASLVVNLVKERTRSGYGVKAERSPDTPGARFRLPKLSDSYIEHRIRNSRKLSRYASISRANNTFTGQMLSSLRVQSVGKNSFSIGFRDRKAKQKAQYLNDMGREFMNLSKKEVSILIKAYENILKTRKL